MKIEEYKDVFLKQMQDDLEFSTPESIARMKGEYEKRNQAMGAAKQFEQIRVGIMLFLLTQPKPETMSSLDYIRITTDALTSVENLALICEPLITKNS